MLRIFARRHFLNAEPDKSWRLSAAGQALSNVSCLIGTSSRGVMAAGGALSNDSTATDDTGSLNGTSLGEDERKDCEALASSSLIVRLFDRRRIALITEYKGCLRQQTRLISADTLQVGQRGSDSAE